MMKVSPNELFVVYGWMETSTWRPRGTWSSEVRPVFGGGYHFSGSRDTLMDTAEACAAGYVSCAC